MAAQNMVDAKALLSAAASVAGSVMLVRSVAGNFLPQEVGNYFSSVFHHHFSRHFSMQFTVVIDEFQDQYIYNEVFEAVHTYLGSKVTPSTRRVRLGKADTDRKFVITMDKNEEMEDWFEKVKVKWRFIVEQVTSCDEPYYIKSYELSFHKKHKEKIVNSYFPYIMERVKVMEQENKAIKLHTSDSNTGVNLEHPMTFDNLAIDFALKKSLMDDLDNFTRGKEFYRKIGKAWKRGYLLAGPPGTGKSSLIAAIANYLNYNIYELDLTTIKDNSSLRQAMLQMSGKSIIVIEDIDCTIKLQNREAEDGSENNQKLTLSGLLNFIDGIWSCCKDERIIIFTTNYKERLDPALLRPGRMDMHIEMSYCTFSAFTQLALNYFGVSKHELFDQIEKVIVKAKVTPAQVGGELMKNHDVGVSLSGLLEFLHKKIIENNLGDDNSSSNIVECV